MKKVRLTENEIKYYLTFGEFSQFDSAEDEFVWADTVTKECNKCGQEKPLTCFAGNTSGRMPFNKDGIRYRRGECIDCGDKIANGKKKAQQIAKKNGMSLKPKETDKCVLCDSKKGLVFDHDHKNETFRGWLCNPCNRALGTIESRLGNNWLEKLQDYVK